MTWLARLKKTAVGPDAYPAKPTKPPFAGFAGTPAALSQNSGGDAQAANDPAHVPAFDREAIEERAAIIEFDGGLSRPEAEALAGMVGNVDRHCWPHTEAMNTAEVDTFTARVHLFTRHGLDNTEAERLADGLVVRDRQADDRRLCLECSRLRCGAGLWRCGQWQRAEMGGLEVPGEVVKLLQRCGAFKEAKL
jgi:hypothetical protein